MRSEGIKASCSYRLLPQFINTAHTFSQHPNMTQAHLIFAPVARLKSENLSQNVSILPLDS